MYRSSPMQWIACSVNHYSNRDTTGSFPPHSVIQELFLGRGTRLGR